MSDKPKLVLVAQIGAAHGIKGEVRLKSFTQDPFSVEDYGPLTARDGRTFEIETARAAAGSSSADMLIVRLKGVADRNAAEKLNGIELSVPQEKLPPAEEGEYYHADLIGLSAVTLSGTILGTVVGVPNYGAGDLLEIAPPTGNTVLVPFTDAAVPQVDIAGGRVILDPPRGIFDDDNDDNEEEGDEA
ncbi:MAG: ribosome maturation factor RimM [Bauldia sp.]